MRARSTSILGNIEARLRVTPSLSFTSRFGVDLMNLKEDQYESRRVAGSYASSADGVAKKGYASADRYVIDNFATLVPDLGDRHEIELTAGGSVEMDRSRAELHPGRGTSATTSCREVTNATIITEFDGTSAESNLISFFARGGYTLDGKYSLRRQHPDRRLLQVRPR